MSTNFKNLSKYFIIFGWISNIVSSMVKWLKHHAYDQHSFGLKPSTLLIEKVISMTLIFYLDMHAFLGLGDSALFHCMLCLFVLRLYWKTQVSSLVMICLRISGSSLIFSSKSLQNLQTWFWFCFWSSDKILGTILAHTFHFPRLCSKIFCTDFLFRLSSSDIICTVNLRSLCTSSFTLVMFSSSSISLLVFSKCLCHLQICVLDITSSP